MNDLLQAAVIRLERQIDLAVMSLGELGAQGPYGCSPAVSKAIEDIAFRSVSIREIRVSSPSATCWADNDHEQVFQAAMAASDPVPSINPAYELAPIEAGEWKGLMVQWTTEDGSLTAFLATEGLLFDILPGELRDHALMEMMLSDQRVVSSYAPEGAAGVVGGFHRIREGLRTLSHQRQTDDRRRSRCILEQKLQFRHHRDRRPDFTGTGLSRRKRTDASPNAAAPAR
ncbi:MAG: hypothetical protein ACT6RF_07160 [Allorhizobium sp.]|uniref:hypothetical protein n=1 Tax=Allorhizobium sp. TaxID=633478 RepID=UPI004034CEA0